MTIQVPVVLVLGLLIAAAVAVGAVLVSRRRAAALAAVGAAARRGAGLGTWCSVAGLALLALGAAGPVASVPVPRSSGTVILAVDVSNSMRADDVKPSRLAAAKKAARAFIAAQPTSVDIGVVAFQRGALSTARPDADHAVALAAVNRLRVSGGTSLGEAVLASLSAITGKRVALSRDGAAPRIGSHPSATVVLLSDGQDTGGVDVQKAAAVAQAAGVHVDTVGVGTAGGTTVEADGFRVRTALDAATLAGIARTTGGSYHPATDADQLDGIADSIDLRLTVADQEVPLAGAVCAVALLLLVVGAAATVLRSGRLI